MTRESTHASWRGRPAGRPAKNPVKSRGLLYYRLTECVYRNNIPETRDQIIFRKRNVDTHVKKQFNKFKHRRRSTNTRLKSRSRQRNASSQACCSQCLLVLTAYSRLGGHPRDISGGWKLLSIPRGKSNGLIELLNEAVSLPLCHFVRLVDARMESEVQRDENVMFAASLLFYQRHRPTTIC